MLRDFTPSTYAALLTAALQRGFLFQTVEEFLTSGSGGTARTLILRHDVDSRPHYAVAMAQLEHDLGVRGTYYLRTIPATFSPEAIRSIHRLGHEVGYHYEDLADAGGETGKAIRTFKANLDRLRAHVPVRTICMHGSPLSRWDNRDLWKTFDYRHFGVIGEPYLDVDFRQTAYVTDTGRAWNSTRAVVRDRVDSPWTFNFRSTGAFADAIRADRVPPRIMITLHPQRWTDRLVPWTLELVSQNVKNVVKAGVNGLRQQ
jgi:hypothetical protein